MQRTHRSNADRKWMPARVRHTRRLYSSGGTAAYVAASVGVAVVAPVLLVVWKAIALGGIGAFLASDHLGKQRFQKQLGALAQGEIPLLELSNQDNGTMVVATGTIEADDTHTLQGILHTAKGVYRRMRFGRWIHEAAVDFVLVSDSGERVPIKAAGARWIMEFRELVEYPASRFTKEHVPAEVRAIAQRLSGDTVSATESVLFVGAKVQIVGYKNVRADASGRFVGFRNAPERAVIQSGPDMPLVITVLSEIETQHAS